MNQVETVVALLIVVAALAIAAKRIALPYPVLLVVAGLALGFVPGLPPLKLDPEMVLLFVLPPLLYPAALFTSWRDFRANLTPILWLAIGLVLVTTLAIGVVAHALGGLPWAAAFALGAIVSPPDAVAATAISKRLRLPRRIVTILEGESLVNDATALVAYRFAVAAVLVGSSFSFGAASLRFLWVASGGVGFGLFVGWIASHVQRRLDDPPIQITISLLTPFVAYIPAERMHVSGVLAVVAAGLFLGWRSPRMLTSRTRLYAQIFWEIVVFLLNGLVFIMIGLQLRGILQRLAGQSFATLITQGILLSATAIVVRMLWVFSAAYLRQRLSWSARRREPSPPWQHAVIIGWTGMRGVVSLAAALAIPLTLADGSLFPGRDYILFATFCIIFATLVLQGLSLPVLIRSLGVEDDGGAELEERTARVKANEAALAYLEELKSNAEIPAETLARLRAGYDDRLRQLDACADCSEEKGGGRPTAPLYQRLEQEALTVERRTIIRLRDEYVINDEVLRRIQRDLDLAEARLRGSGTE
jgi:CPA1 family monovalent cation:H+ antiporter